MPIYDYECLACGHLDKDAVVSVADRDAARECGICGWRMDRLPSVPAAPVVLGYSERNGYSKSDEVLRPSAIPGIKTAVKAL